MNHPFSMFDKSVGKPEEERDKKHALDNSSSNFFDPDPTSDSDMDDYQYWMKKKAKTTNGSDQDGDTHLKSRSLPLHTSDTRPSDDHDEMFTEIFYKKPLSSDSDSENSMDEDEHQNYDLGLLYQSFLLMKEDFPLTKESERDEDAQNLYHRQIERVCKTLKFLMRGGNKLRESMKSNQSEILLSTFYLIIIGDIIGETMKLYAKSSKKIVRSGLDFLCELSMIAKTSLIEEGNRRKTLEKRGSYDVSEKDLNLDIGYSFGLAMLAIQCENIYDDVQQAYFQPVADNTSKDARSPIYEDLIHTKFSQTGHERVKSSISASSTEDPLPGFVSNFFIGNKFRHEFCIMCRKHDGLSVRYCLGCGACLHVEGRCYHSWHSGPRMKFTGDNQFLCPSCRAGQALVQACYENNLDMIYDLLVIQAASPLYKYIIEPNKPYFPIDSVTSLHISVVQNNYILTSMLLYGAYEMLHCTNRNECDSAIPSAFPNVCWGRDGCQHGFQDMCWQQPKCQEFKHCKLNPFDRAYYRSTMNLSHPPPVECMLLLAARGGGDINKVKLITQIRLSKESKRKNSSDCINEGIPLPKQDISLGAEMVPISWINDTNDGAELNTDFVYITQTVESRSTRISWFQNRNQKQKSSKKLLASWENTKTEELNHTPLQSLQLHVGKSSKCHSGMNKALKKIQNVGMDVEFECNYLCPCSNNKRNISMFSGRRDVIDCGNRKISSGIKHKFQIFRTDSKGWGVRTLQSIKKGEIVCSYAGICMLENDMKKLDKITGNTFTKSYIINLTMDKKMNNSSHVINGNEFRSFSGFINQECSNANLELFHCLGNHLDVSFPTIGLRAKVNIDPLTELSFNCGNKIAAN